MPQLTDDLALFVKNLRNYVERWNAHYPDRTVARTKTRGLNGSNLLLAGPRGAIHLKADLVGGRVAHLTAWIEGGTPRSVGIMAHHDESDWVYYLRVPIRRPADITPPVGPQAFFEYLADEFT